MKEEEEERFAIFKKNLRRLRASKDISARELSEVLKLKTVKRVADLEDEGTPNLEEIIAIANYFKVSIDCLLTQEATISVTFPPKTVYRS